MAILPFLLAYYVTMQGLVAMQNHPESGQEGVGHWQPPHSPLGDPVSVLLWGEGLICMIRVETPNPILKPYKKYWKNVCMEDAIVSNLGKCRLVVQFLVQSPLCALFLMILQW